MENIDPKYIAAWREHFNRQDAKSRVRAARARKDLRRAEANSLIYNMIKSQEYTPYPF